MLRDAEGWLHGERARGPAGYWPLFCLVDVRGGVERDRERETRRGHTVPIDTSAWELSFNLDAVAHMYILDPARLITYEAAYISTTRQVALVF